LTQQAVLEKQFTNTQVQAQSQLARLALAKFLLLAVVAQVAAVLLQQLVVAVAAQVDIFILQAHF
jgi:hypothetical protein